MERKKIAPLAIFNGNKTFSLGEEVAMEGFQQVVKSAESSMVKSITDGSGIDVRFTYTIDDLVKKREQQNDFIVKLSYAGVLFFALICGLIRFQMMHNN